MRRKCVDNARSARYRRLLEILHVLFSNPRTRPSAFSTLAVATLLVACGKGTETTSPAISTPSGSASASASDSASASASAKSALSASASAGAGAGVSGKALTRAEAPAWAMSRPTCSLSQVAPSPWAMPTPAAELDERPAHSVTLAPFLLDKTEVTQDAYAECVAANVCRPQSEVVQGVYPGSKGPKKPVNGVAWDDANTYCTWRHTRLPREAEFERAVRDDDGRRFPWGNDKPSPDKTVFNRAIGPNPGQTTDDVGSHPLGRGPYGQDDLAGNVWEWQSDLYDPYAYRRAGAPRGEPGTCDEIMAALNELRTQGKQGFTGTNPIPTECEHSIRGGAFNYPPEGLRSTNRVHHPSRYRIPMLGFRCAKDAK